MLDLKVSIKLLRNKVLAHSSCQRTYLEIVHYMHPRGQAMVARGPNDACKAGIFLPVCDSIRNPRK